MIIRGSITGKFRNDSNAYALFTNKDIPPSKASGENNFTQLRRNLSYWEVIKMIINEFPNKTAEFFYKMSILCFTFGYPNFWIGDFNLPIWLIVTVRYLARFFNLAIYLLIPFEEAAFYTQTNVSKKQEYDMMLYGFSHPLLWSCYIILSRQPGNIQNLLRDILELKREYNDINVEKQMLKSTTMFSAAVIFYCTFSMVFTSANATLGVVAFGESFTTIITAYPLVEDQTPIANATRVVINMLWWLFISRVFSGFTYVVSLTSAVSYQYTNLQSFFYNLDKIFSDDNATQNEKEILYEKALKKGIALHSATLRCVKNLSSTCGVVFSGQFVFIVLIMTVLMYQMAVSERTLVNIFNTVFTAIAVLFSSGLFFWSAGNITVEASHLGTSMYCSGWENCRKDSSIRVRKLIVIAIARAQRPVQLKGLGLFGVSYDSYLQVVKTSYSVFSVLY